MFLPFRSVGLKGHKVLESFELGFLLEDKVSEDFPKVAHLFLFDKMKVVIEAKIGEWL